MRKGLRRGKQEPRAWQRMLSGRRLDLLDPSPMDIEIGDIAHGLARVARWNGQTTGENAFSVAQHSIVVEEIEVPEEGRLKYRVSGNLFFASADVFAASFEHHGHPTHVEIDMSGAHLWDVTGVAAVDKVVFRYRRQGAKVVVSGMNTAAQTLVTRVGRHGREHLPAGLGAH